MRHESFRLLYLAFSFIFLHLSCSPGNPSRDECLKLLYHNVKVIAEDDSIQKDVKELFLKSILAVDKREVFVSECQKTRSRSRFQCEMNASSFADLKKCALTHPSPE